MKAHNAPAWQQVSAWMDGEEVLDPGAIEALSRDAQCREAWRYYHVISAGIRQSRDNHPTAATSWRRAGPRWLARAAAWVLGPMVIATLWLYHTPSTTPGDPVTAVPETTGRLRHPGATDRNPVTVAEDGTPTVASTLSLATDFRTDYLIYHSAYLANYEDNGLLPYIRLGSRQADD